MSRKTGLSAFWMELRRRRVVRSGGFYVAAAFVLLQLGEIVLPAFDAPAWVLQSLVVVLLLGLPVTLAVAWVYDLTPFGVLRTRESRSETKVSIAPRIALLLVTVTMAGLAVLWFQQGARTGSEDVLDGVGGAGAATDVLAAADVDTTVTAIAVLPLEDLTPGGEDLFTRQLHEEIVTLLSRLTALRVVSRTSVERYRDTDKLLPEIAAELSVQRIVTGSVAMASGSDSVRISIQLLDGPTDTHLRSVTYQHEMKDILRLQTEVAVDIARMVGGELGVFGVPEQFAEVDPETYRLTLHGQQELESGTPEGRQAAIEYLDRAVERDSSFALPRVWRSAAILAAALEGERVSADRIAMAQEDLRQARESGGFEEEVTAVEVVAREVSPGLGWGAGWLGPAGGDSIPEATGQPPLPVDSLTRAVGEQTRIGRQLRGPSRFRRADRYMEQGQFDSAVVMIRTYLTENPTAIPAWASLEDLHLQHGDYDGAVGVREEWIRATQDDAAATAIEALHATFDADDPWTYWEWRRDHNTARQERGDSVSQVELATVAMHLGDRNGALNHLEAAAAAERPEWGLAFLRTNPVWDPVRRNPRFIQIQQQIDQYIQKMRESRESGGTRGRGPGAERDGRPSNGPPATALPPIGASTRGVAWR